MKQRRDTQGIDLTGRIKSLEHFTGSLVRRAEGADDRAAEVVPIDDAPLARMPAPRRSRVYLRGGRGQGVFADLTVTAPLPRPEYRGRSEPVTGTFPLDPVH